MNITFKLFATLADYLPPDAVRNQANLSLNDAQTVGEVIAAHRLPEKLVHLVLLNGAFVAPELRNTQALKEGDTLAIWPPIAGG